jgi:hypothetical protein
MSGAAELREQPWAAPCLLEALAIPLLALKIARPPGGRSASGDGSGVRVGCDRCRAAD